MASIYRLKKIEASYNGETVLKNISLEIGIGECLSIAGPNGAGKSTLLKIMAGLMRPDGGSVHFGGENVEKLTARALARRVGYLPQLNQPAFSYNCFDMVMIGRTPYLKGLMMGGERDRQIVRKAMEATDCLQFAERDINGISAGERQCVYIARSLAAQPEVLLLDEPAASLDLQHSVSLYRLLEKLNKKQGITIVTVSHNLNITSQFADRIVILHKGEILADGPAGKVFTIQHLARVYGDSFDLINDKGGNRPIVVPKRNSKDK